MTISGARRETSLKSRGPEDPFVGDEQMSGRELELWEVPLFIGPTTIQGVPGKMSLTKMRIKSLLIAIQSKLFLKQIVNNVC